MTSEITSARALLDLFPALEQKLRFERLAKLPTPVARLDQLAAALGRPGLELYEKRDDLTSTIYGGNKVRTLEVLFGDALDRRSTHIYATGAYGSNHATASAMHAPRVGLTPGIVLYPQPPSRAALENLQVVLSRQPHPPVLDLPHWSALPFGIWLQSRRSRARGERATIMMPGGAVPRGALGYVSAGLELALQVEAGVLPPPRKVIVAVGSNCTTAGLLVGLNLAARRGIGLARAPELACVRVTPWPVTSRLRILSLAHRTSALLAELSADPSLEIGASEMGPLRIVAGYLGPGYGLPTEEGRAAMRHWSEHAGHELETTYSGKSAAFLIDGVRAGETGPILYWSTKSSAPLPAVDPEDLRWAPARMRRWMDRAGRGDRP
jgi:D-cysteine desulfhydrase